MVILPAEGNILAGHPVKSPRHIPGLVRIAGILGEIRCSRGGSSAIDGRQQNQIASRIIDFPSAQRKRVLVAIEPQAVVDHITKEALLGTLRRITGATDATTVLATHIAGESKRGFADKIFRMVVVFDLKAAVVVIGTSPWGFHPVSPQAIRF